MQCVALRCGVSQYVAVCCSVMQCVAARVASRVSNTLDGTQRFATDSTVCCSLYQCVAVCIRVLQCVAVRCSVLQCVVQCVAGSSSVTV